MNTRRAIATLVSLGICLSSAAPAALVYRWVDDDGVVHFSGDPPAGVDAAVVDASMPSGGLSPSTPYEDAAAGGEVAESEEPELSYAEQRRQERAERREERRAENAERQRKCAAMRKQRAALEPSPRVIVRDEEGNPVRMSDEDRLAALQEAKTYLAEHCE